MSKDLTTSKLDRQNILNNEIALEEIRQNYNIPGILFEGQYRYTKEMLISFINGTLSYPTVRLWVLK